MLTKEDLKQIGDVMDDKLVDVLDAVNKGFSGVQEQFTGVTKDVAGLKQDVAGLKQDVAGLKQEVTEIKAVMVTKSYLDDKMADLKSDLIGYDRKLEKKTDALADALVDRRALTVSDVERLEQVRVFPRIMR